jgi:hypothetical protein
MKLLVTLIEFVKSKEFFRILREIFILLTFIFLGVNIIVVLGNSLRPDISFVALNLILLSLAISFHAGIIASKSDEKMKSIANADFTELVERFFDFKEKLKIKYNRNDTVRWHTNLKKAKDLIKYIKDEEDDEIQDKIRAIKFPVTFLIKDFPWESKQLAEYDLDQIQNFIKDAVKFGFVNEEEVKKYIKK